MNTGKCLKYLRKNKLSQGDLARLLHASTSLISTYKRGEPTLSPIKLSSPCLISPSYRILEAFSTSFYSIINPKVAAQLVQDLHEYHFEIESLEKRLCNKLSNNVYFTSYYLSTYPLSEIYNGTRSHKHVLDLYQNYLWKGNIRIAQKNF